MASVCTESSTVYLFIHNMCTYNIVLYKCEQYVRTPKVVFFTLDHLRCIKWDIIVNSNMVGSRWRMSNHCSLSGGKNADLKTKIKT